MGLFDGLINAISGGLSADKLKAKKYCDTNEQEFLNSIPEGQAFTALSADRFVNPYDKTQSLMERLFDFLGGAIRKVTKSYWKHAIVGIKLNGIVWIIESLPGGITKNKLDVYFDPKNQLKLFFPPITHKESREVWQRANNREGEAYDFPELYDKVSILGSFGVRYGSKNKTVCHAFAAWAFKPFCDILDPKLPYRDTAPGSINQWLQPNPDVKIIVYNLDPMQHN